MAAINDIISGWLPGDYRIFYTANQVEIGDVSTITADQQYILEFLQLVNDLGLPLSVLWLKISMPVMLLCNIHINSGLCNSTCMIIMGIHQCLLEVCKAAINGSAVDLYVYLIPCIDLMTRLGCFPFVLHY
jgi:hypothetical protein